MKRLGAGFEAFPVMAILRGLQPEIAVDIGTQLVQNGIGALEVPLNRPGAVDAIARLTERFGQQVAIGAGTVTSKEQLVELKVAGAVFAVSPHTDAALIKATKNAQLISIPGVATPSEAYLAIRSGADYLKLFPCDHLLPAAVKALSSILPEDIPLLCVGGIDESNMAAFLNAGASGFGIGSALFRPGVSARAVGEKTIALRRAVAAMINNPGRIYEPDDE